MFLQTEHSAVQKNTTAVTIERCYSAAVLFAARAAEMTLTWEHLGVTG